jgi:hypothetical protein
MYEKRCPAPANGSRIVSSSGTILNQALKASEIEKGSVVV